MYDFSEMLTAELEKLLEEYSYYKMYEVSTLSDVELQELTTELKTRWNKIFIIKIKEVNKWNSNVKNAKL